jgi:GNAT superfamily N-acetyltransferase
MQDDIIIRKAIMADWEETMAMTWKTFLKFEAKDYGLEGVNSFRNFIADPLLRRMFLLGTYHMYVATCNEKIVGMVSLRDQNHISLLFVDEAYHKRGIGRRLVETIGGFSKEEYGKEDITVNAAPYGVGFYKKVGFFSTSPLMTNDGIKYISMKKKIGETNGKII